VEIYVSVFSFSDTAAIDAAGSTIVASEASKNRVDSPDLLTLGLTKGTLGKFGFRFKEDLVPLLSTFFCISDVAAKKLDNLSLVKILRLV